MLRCVCIAGTTTWPQVRLPEGFWEAFQEQFAKGFQKPFVEGLSQDLQQILGV